MSDTIPSPEVTTLTEKNHSYILKEIHDDLDTYFLCSYENISDFENNSCVNIICF